MSDEALKARQIRALKGPIKWMMPDGTVVEDTAKDFIRRGVYMPYIPFYQTPLPPQPDTFNFPPK